VSASAGGTPAPTLTVTGPPPAGVTFVDNGGGTGTPVAQTGGVHALTFTASNGVGPDSVQAFTLKVLHNCVPYGSCLRRRRTSAEPRHATKSRGHGAKWQEVRERTILELLAENRIGAAAERYGLNEKPLRVR
jgi:hypothetical protein